MTKIVTPTIYEDAIQDFFLINELISASTKVTQHEDLSNLMKDYSNRFFNCETKGFWLFDKHDKKLKLYYSDGLDEDEKKEAERTVMDRHPGYVFRTGKTLWTHDQLTTKNKYSIGSKRKIEMRSRLFIPIGLGDKIIGTFGIASSRPRAFTKKDFALLQILNTTLFNSYITVTTNEKITRNRETIEMHRLLADNTSNQLVITDKFGAITWANKGFETQTEYPLAEIIGRKPGSFLVGKNTDPAAMKILRDAQINGTSANTKIINYSRSGKEYISSIQINPFHNERGELDGFVAIQQDITRDEKKNIEIKHAFQKIKELSRFPLENPSPVFRFSKKDLHLLFANPAAKNVIKENLENVEMLQKWRQLLLKCQQNSENFQFQTDTKNAFYSCSVVYIDNEKHFNIYCTDITELVKKQNKITSISDELARQKNFFEELFDNIPVDIAVFNREHQYLYLNKEAIKDDEFRHWMVGKDDFDYARRKKLPPEFAQLRRDYFLKLINNQVQEPWIDKQLSQDGSYRYKDRRYHTYGDGKTIIGYGVDITLRKKAEEDLLSKNNLLEIRNKELQQFAYIASHDLQEPIGTMTMSAKLLLGNLVNYDNELFARQVQYIDFIMKSSQRMQDLVSGLLSYSRIGHNKEVERVDCTEIVNDVVSDLSERIILKNASIHVGGLPVLECYPLEMRMLFQNLISNALKFTKPDIPPEITISCRESKQNWEFSIKDNGIGINKKHFDKIFVIFKRLHTREEYEGTGIGLAHCMKIALLHDGALWVDSVEGNGSTFNFTVSKNLAYENQNK